MSFVIFMNSWALCLQMFLLLTASPSLFLPGFRRVGQFDIFPQFLNARFHFLFLTFFSLRFSLVTSVDLIFKRTHYHSVMVSLLRCSAAKFLTSNTMIFICSISSCLFLLIFLSLPTSLLCM